MDAQRTVDPLAVAARRARESAGAPLDDAEMAAAVLETLLRELPAHFGPEAHAAYRFWLRNRIAALQDGKPFHPWVMTTSYQYYPELFALDHS